METSAIWLIGTRALVAALTTSRFVDLFDPRALVAPQAEGDRDQAVLLAQIGERGAGEAGLQQHGHVFVGDARQVGFVGLDGHGDLEHLGVPIVVDVVGAGDLAKLLFGLGGHAAERFDVVAEEADLHGHADRRPGFELLDRHAGGGNGGRQVRASAGATTAPCRADRACERGSGRSCRPVARARSRARIAARLGRRKSCRRGFVAFQVFDVAG